MYKRLMRFVEDAKANESLSDYDSKHSATLEAMKEAEAYLQHFREYQGFQGQTGDAIDQWLERAERRLELWRSSYLATTQVEVEMRRVMKHAREEAEMLSPVLVDARLDKLRDVAEVRIPVMEQYGLVGMAYNAVASTGAAVYDAVAAQANNQREASSTDILQRLNDSMQGLANHAARIKELQEELKSRDRKWDPGDLPQPSDPSVADQLEKGYKDVSSHVPGVYPGNRDTDYGRSDLRGPNSGLYPNGFDDPTAQDADAEKLRKLQSGRIPDKFTKDGELGSRSNPITDPEDLKGIDLLHSRIGGERYANGTVGGYTPAPPNDRHHPLWIINGGPSSRFDASGRTSLAGAGAGAGKDDKKGKRRKYTAFKFEDDEDDALPPGYVNTMSQTYGSDKDLKPPPRRTTDGTLANGDHEPRFQSPLATTFCGCVCDDPGGRGHRPARRPRARRRPDHGSRPASLRLLQAGSGAGQGLHG